VKLSFVNGMEISLLYIHLY